LGRVATKNAEKIASEAKRGSALGIVYIGRDCRKTKTTIIHGIISKKSTVPYEQNYTIAEVLSTFSDSLGGELQGCSRLMTKELL